MSRGSRRKGHNAGAVSIFLIVMVLVAVMSIQIWNLKQKSDLLAKREEDLKEQLQDESSRSEEIEEFDMYTKTMEYIREMAHKLGIISDNEIIFREDGE